MPLICCLPACPIQLDRLTDCPRQRVSKAWVSTPMYKCTALGATKRGGLLGVSLTLYVILMFYCTEIRKAPIMLSCQCETWRDAFLCMGMPLQNVYAGLHGPFVSQLAETLRWKLSMCIIMLLCRGSLTSVAFCLKKIWLQTFETFILEGCMLFC